MANEAEGYPLQAQQALQQRLHEVDDGPLFTITDNDKVWLSPTARFFARQWGMTDREMAYFLLLRKKEAEQHGEVMTTPPQMARGYADGEFIPTVTPAEMD